MDAVLIIFMGMVATALLLGAICVGIDPQPLLLAGALLLGLLRFATGEE